MTPKHNPIVLSEKLWKATRYLRRQGMAAFVLGFGAYLMMERAGTGTATSILFLAGTIIFTAGLLAICLVWIAKVANFVPKSVLKFTPQVLSVSLLGFAIWNLRRAFGPNELPPLFSQLGFLSAVVFVITAPVVFWLRPRRSRRHA